MKHIPSDYTRHEDIINGSIHGLGVFLGLMALINLTYLGLTKGGLIHVLSYVLFGLSLTSLYLASTLYHFSIKPKLRMRFKKLDHICIYFLIAGTYTPFLLINLKGQWSLGLMLAIWGLAILGTLLKIFLKRKFHLLSVLLYLIMGWLIVIGREQITQNIPEQALNLIYIGGLFYTLGVPFYLMKKVKHHHAVWHIFVLAGSISHYFAVLNAFIP